MSEGDAPKRGSRALPRLHVVTDDDVLARRSWLETAYGVLDVGGPGVALHVRGPGTAPRAILEVTTALVERAGATGASVFVNDRVDVALAGRADGAHLGGRSLPPSAARAVLGAGRWIGVSCHDVDEITEAVRGGADYAFVGTIFRTPSHPGTEGAGLDAVEVAVGRTPELPVLGIGGIGPVEAARVAAVGAYGVAAIRGVWDARDPKAAVMEYLEALGN